MRLKTYEYTGLLIGLFIALEPSYIHPDEHFQTLEPILQWWSGYKGTIAWEFLPENASRSVTILKLYYTPMLWLNDYIFHLKPVGLLYLYRIQNYLLYTVIASLFLEFCEVSITHKTKAKFFIRTSYVTWVFQSHTFSNSLETILLLLLLFVCQYCIYEVRSGKSPSFITSFWIGALISIGIFNRMTFPAFLVLPLLSVFYHCFISHWLPLAFSVISASVVSAIIIFFDTKAYNPVNGEWIIAPWNNLVYNMNVDNIAQHGLHPRYTHLLVNLPLLCGPILILLLSKRYILKLPALSALSGVLILSIFKHQELRFLVPIVPAICASINLELFDTFIQGEVILTIWFIFNIVMGLVLGVFHQAGIISLISQFSSHDIPVHVWWKTYSPPTWIYANYNLTVSTTNFVDNIEYVENVNWNVTFNHVVDLKGSDVELLNETLTNFSEFTDSIQLILPNTVMEQLEPLREEWNFTVDRETSQHLDLDHIDFPRWETMKPGLKLLNVSHII